MPTQANNAIRKSLRAFLPGCCLLMASCAISPQKSQDAIPAPSNTPSSINNVTQDIDAETVMAQQVLKKLLNFQSEMVNLHPKKDQLDIVKTLIAQARTYDLESFDDLTSFSALGFDFDLQFYDDPIVKKELARVKDKEITMFEMMDIVPISTWGELSKKNDWRKSSLRF
jgi:hypothetical protein